MGFYTLIGRRLLQFVPIVVFATFVVFSLLHFARSGLPLRRIRSQRF